MCFSLTLLFLVLQVTFIFALHFHDIIPTVTSPFFKKEKEKQREKGQRAAVARQKKKKNWFHGTDRSEEKETERRGERERQKGREAGARAAVGKIDLRRAE